MIGQLRIQGTVPIHEATESVEARVSAAAVIHGVVAPAGGKITAGLWPSGVSVPDAAKLAIACVNRFDIVQKRNSDPNS